MPLLLALLGCQPPDPVDSAPNDTDTDTIDDTDAVDSDDTDDTDSAVDSDVPSPWASPIERCGDGADDDGDGLADEDCAPSLWAGVFVPSGGGDFAGPGLIAAIEADSGRPMSVVQTYRSTSAVGATNATADLAAIWGHGAVAHLNVEPLGYTAAQYASGGTDTALAADLTTMATAIADSLQDAPDGRLLLTFGAEMNGSWTDWGCLPPATFKALHQVFRTDVTAALAARALDPRRVRWVFGPDSRGSGTCATASAYFPGEDQIDLLGLSAYRSGTDSVAVAVIEPAHDLMDALGWPTVWRRDRFAVLQTASRTADRAAFTSALYADLAADPAFVGVIWFDAADWALQDDAGAPLAGFSAFTAALAALPTADAGLEGTFEPWFWDVSRADPYYAEIQTLRSAGHTSGCATSPPLFCPEDALQRRDAAVLIGRAFAIDAASAFPGCEPATECSTDPLRRAELAVALATAAGRAPREEAPFTDLGALSATEREAVAALAWDDAIDGCGDGRFCPEDVATRAVGAAWIVRAADLPPLR